MNNLGFLNIIKKESVWYVLLWLIYLTQGALYEKGSIISQFTLTLILVVSFVNFIKVNIIMPNKFFVVLSLLIMMLTIYGVILILFGDVQYVSETKIVKITSYSYLKGVYMSLLPIYSFYIYVIRKEISERELRYLFFVFILLAAIRYFYNMNLSREMGKEEMVNNFGYTILSCLPLLVLWNKKPLLQYVMLCVIACFSIMSLKRGTMLVGFLCYMIFFIGSIKSGNMNFKHRFLIVVLVLLVISFAGFLLMYLINNSALFNERLIKLIYEKGGVRRDMYSFFVDYDWHSTTLLEFLFGQGANATLDISQNYAHNDWLEILTNNGFVGVVIYFVYWYQFYHIVRRSREYHDLHAMITIVFVMYFMMTFFSMSYGNMFLSATCTIGYVMAMLDKRDDTITDEKLELEEVAE